MTLSSAALSEQSTVRNNYGFNFTTDNTNGAGTETIGSNAHYGDGGLSYNGTVVTAASALNGGNTILITAKNTDGSSVGNGVIAPAGNYLFGNFNQNGVRDYSAVIESVNAALSLHHVDGAANSIFTADGGVPNSTGDSFAFGTPGWVRRPTTHQEAPKAISSSSAITTATESSTARTSICWPRARRSPTATTARF